MSKGRDYPLSKTPEPLPIDNTRVSVVKPLVKVMTDASLSRKVDIAKKLYKANPTEVFSDALDRAKVNESKSKQKLK